MICHCQQFIKFKRRQLSDTILDVNNNSASHLPSMLNKNIFVVKLLLLTRRKVNVLFDVNVTILFMYKLSVMSNLIYNNSRL